MSLPSVLPTFLDVAKLEAGLGYPLIEENISLAPELRIIPAVSIRGTTVELTVRTDLPSVQFRHVNEGVPTSKSKYRTEIFKTAILDHQVVVDTQLVANSPAGGLVLENHMAGAMESAVRHIGKQTWYGTANDSKGFVGVIAQMPSGSTHEVDAQGSSDKTSAFMVRLGREALEYIYPEGNFIRTGGEWKIETVTESNGKRLQAWTNWLTGGIGLRLANRNAVVRIKNLGSDQGKGLDDDLLFEARYKFIENLGVEPTHIFLNPRSNEQLRQSRTTNFDDGRPIDLLRSWQGIPIIETNSIVIGETI